MVSRALVYTCAMAGKAEADRADILNARPRDGMVYARTHWHSQQSQREAVANLLIRVAC